MEIPAPTPKSTRDIKTRVTEILCAVGNADAFTTASRSTYLPPKEPTSISRGLIAKWLELDLTDPLVKAEIDAALQSPGVQRTERDGRTFYHIPSEYLALRIQEIGDTALKAAHELLAEEGRKMYGRQNKE